MNAIPRPLSEREPDPQPVHRAEDLLQGWPRARIVLRDQTYVLSVTRAGKLILTK